MNTRTIVMNACKRRGIQDQKKRQEGIKIQGVFSSFYSWGSLYPWLLFLWYNGEIIINDNELE